MSDKLPLEKNAEEKLGEYLKRARLAAGIDQAELAREIRITPDMLDHLENGRYDKLPVQAYVRGYLNTICTRLDLNRAKVLDWYAGEVGRNYSAVIATDQLLMGAQSKSKSEGGNGKFVLMVAAAILLIFVLVMNANNDGKDGQDANHLADSLDSVAKAESLQTADSLQTTDTVGLSADSVIAADSSDTNKVRPDSSKKAPASTVETTLKFECAKDSTWVRVKKAGGLSWARLIHKDDKPRFVSHTDTMKVSVGSPEKTRVFINDEKVKIPSNYFKVLNGKILEE